MKYGSVCSGIEGASVAWRELGWRPAFLSEIEAFPRAVLKHHYPEVPLHGDFTTIRAGDYDAIDVLVGGTPCQSFSVAGLRGGLADDRGNLALEYLRLADRLRPRWVVWENVPGVFSSRPGLPPDEDDDAADAGPIPGACDAEPPGADFAAFLSGLVRWDVAVPVGGWRNAGILAPGPVDGAYGVAWRVLDAQYFGVAQRRRRVFVVGHLGDWRRAAAVLLERHGLQGNPPPRREAGQGAPTLPSRSSAGGGMGTDFDCDGGLISHSLRAQAQSSHRADSQTYVPEISPALKARDYKGQSSNGVGDGSPLVADTLTVGANQTTGFIGDAVAHTLKADGFDASEDGTGRGTPLVAIPDSVGALTAACGQNAHGGSGLATDKGAEAGHIIPVQPPLAFDTTQMTHPANRSVPKPGDPSHPLTSGGQPPAIAFNWQNGGGYGEANEGLGISVEHAGPLDRSTVKAVAFAVRGREDGAVPEVSGEQTSALRGSSGGSSRDHVAAFTCSEQANGFAWEREYAPTVTAHRASDTSNQQTGVRIGAAVRRLTPRECARLQGFPDDYLDIEYRGKPAADGPKYKALGNSFAVPVVRWIGRRIAAVEAIKEGP